MGRELSLFIGTFTTLLAIINPFEVLRYRAMVNRISAGGLEVRRYFHRYTDDALDLCDALASYVPGAKVKLDEISKMLGLSGKPEGIDGSRV
jgi:3'-5' exonuclease